MNFTRDPAAITRFLEALYDLEQPRAAWFRGTVRAAAAAFERGAGVGMILYDASGDLPQIHAIDAVNVERRSVEMATELHRHPQFTQAVLNSYRNFVCATMLEHIHPGTQRHEGEQRYSELGLQDHVMVNGGNPDGLGCVMYLFSESRLELPADSRALLTRIASHLSTAYRLHRRLHDAERTEHGVVDAVIRVDGRVEHANDALKDKPLLRDLSAAVGRREWAKSGEGRNDGQRSVAAWQPMVAARWSLVDAYERNGVRYVTARENSPVNTGISSLSAREQQVTSLAALGHSNKLIAYELGLAHSTVRVLFARAAVKLGAKTRSEVIARIRAHA